MVTKEEENFLRIVYLHYRVATGALTNFFDKLHPSLSAELNIPGNKAILQDLYIPPPRKKRVLYRGQWDTLYPPPGPTTVTSADLDLTLIVCLLRNISPVVTEPATGFDNLPPSHDKSDGANIARLKYYKNFLVSHSKDGKLPDADFVGIWNDLEQAIKGLDNAHATAASLKDAETKMLDNSMAQLLSTQMQLVTKVSNFEEELQHISIHIDKDVQEKKQLKQITETLDERMKIKEDRFEKEFKECKKNVDRISERLDTSEVQMYERAESIETCLEEIQKLQQSLDLQFTRHKTIAIESKKEKEDFVKDVQSLCSHIQVDVTKHEERIATLENSYGTLQEIKRDVGSLKRKLDTLKEEVQKQVEDHIPQHIRAQHREEVREWEQDETTFLETRATRHILDSLPLHTCIVVTGSSGCGKSSNIHHAALHLRDSFGYEIIPVLTGPTDIIGYYNENKKQVFVVDDICGKETINTQTLQRWRDYSDKLEKTFKITENDVANKNDGMIANVLSPVLLISCRLHIYKETQFQHIPLLTKNECNLVSPEFCLLQEERIVMLNKYLPDDIITNVEQVLENVDFFPLLCKLSKDKTFDEVKELFTAPLISIERNIKNIINENKNQWCALSLCILFDGEFDTNWLTLRPIPTRISNTLNGVVKEFDIDLNKERHRNALKAGFSTLNGTYFKLRGTEYRMIHDKIYKWTTVICGQHLTECFIKHASVEFIRDHFIFESLTEVHSNDGLIVLDNDQEEEYFKRLLYDLGNRVLTSTFHNKQLTHKSFINKLICFLEKSDDAKLWLKERVSYKRKLSIRGYEGKRTIFSVKQSLGDAPSTPLVESASSGCFDIVHFLIYNIECKVNHTDVYSCSPLHKASEKGHFDIVKLLLEKGADVSQRNVFDKTALHAACSNGHIDIVKLLLEKGADVSEKDVYEKSALHAACERGHIDIVKLLLQINADVSQLSYEYGSPLFVACREGHIDTVELLLQNNADVSQCDIYKNTPLYGACKGGHKDTVQLLLQKNADVSQCNNRGKSPLYAACKRGHIDTVKLLLQINADVSQPSYKYESPLFVACKRGHTDIVELLLQNNADVSQCDYRDNSPLHAACEGGQTDIVELLLQNNADDSPRNDDGESPLYVACNGGYKDTVQLLLLNNADVSHCNSGGESPLSAACRGGHTGIVELLLQERAEISQCNTTRESPLFVASK